MVYIGEILIVIVFMDLYRFICKYIYIYNLVNRYSHLQGDLFVFQNIDSEWLVELCCWTKMD